MDRNNTSFPVELASRLRELHRRYVREREGEGDDARAAKALKYHQYVVRAIASDPELAVEGARGLLINHTMGMGKTILGVALALALVALGRAKGVVVIASKALHANMRGAVAKYLGLLHPEDDEAAREKRAGAALKLFRFASLDAYNMATQVARATSGIEGPGALEGRVVLMDEAHNWMRGVINSPSETTNARRLYEMLMAARKIHVFFLTGKVPTKDPFELVPAFNVLAGRDILPTQYDQFYQLYVERARGRPGAAGYRPPAIKNRDRLANRLLGLVSFVTHTLPASPGEEAAAGEEPPAAQRRTAGFPEERPAEVVEVEMGRDQYRAYTSAREKEEKEGKGGGGGRKRGPLAPIARTPALAMPGAEGGGGKTYHNRSRSLGNYAPPPELTDGIADVYDYPDEAFGAEHSPKIAAMLERIATATRPVLIYSQFAGVGGLAAVERYLRRAGYAEYSPPRETRGGGGVPTKRDLQAGMGMANLVEMQRRAELAGHPPHERQEMARLPRDFREALKAAHEEGFEVAELDPDRPGFSPGDLERPRTVGPKPMRGVLWASTASTEGRSWVAFARRVFGLDPAGRRIEGYKFDEGRILTLKTAEDLDRFEAEYLVCPGPDGGYSEIQADCWLCESKSFVDWPRVAEKWGGVRVRPYLCRPPHQRRQGAPRGAVPDGDSGDLCSGPGEPGYRAWYMSFDADTVVVWDPAAVLEHRLVFAPRDVKLRKAVGAGEAPPAMRVLVTEDEVDPWSVDYVPEGLPASAEKYYRPAAEIAGMAGRHVFAVDGGGEFAAHALLSTAIGPDAPPILAERAARPAGPRLWLREVYTRDEKRRRGYGRAVLEKALELAGGAAVDLYVRDDNGPAVRLYEALGFVGGDVVEGWRFMRRPGAEAESAEAESAEGAETESAEGAEAESAEGAEAESAESAESAEGAEGAEGAESEGQESEGQESEGAEGAEGAESPGKKARTGTRGKKERPADPLQGLAPGPRYAVHKGATAAEDRAAIIAAVNDARNAHGEYVKVFLISKTGAEGLDLKGFEQVHVLEPYWDMSRVAQVFARVARYGSHEHLPEAERWVQPHVYLATANAELFEAMRPSAAEQVAPPSRHFLLEDSSIDEQLYARANEREALNDLFSELLREVCLECMVNGYGSCRACAPTNARLFHEDAARDLETGDPCQPLRPVEEEVRAITVDGVEYFYREDPAAPFGLRIYRYDERLKAPATLPPSSPAFLRVLAALRPDS